MKRYSVQAYLQQLRFYAISLQKHYHKFSRIEISLMKQKIKTLWAQVSSAIGSKQLRSCLGASLVASLMMVNQVNGQNFADPVSMYNVEFDGFLVPELADFDQDGDLDIFGFSIDYSDEQYYPLGFGYQENIGDVNTPDFTVPLINPFGLNSFGVDFLDFDYVLSWEVSDLDNDGDSDLLGIALSYDSLYFGNLFYHENIGTPSEPEFNTFNYQATDVDLQNHYSREITLVDFDDDGDLDVMSFGRQFEESIPEGLYLFNVLFYENIGDETSMELADVVINPSGFSQLVAPIGFGDAALYLSSIEIADFDLDGDLDGLVVIGSYDAELGSKFMYSENVDGDFDPWVEIENLAFNSPLEDTDLLVINTSGDLDGDGDVDLFYSVVGEYAYEDYKTNMFFVENLSVVSSTENTLGDAPATIYPTVTSSSITIDFDEINTYPISILSADGKLVKQYKDQQWSGATDFDLSELTTGHYFVRIITEKNVYSLPFIKQ